MRSRSERSSARRSCSPQWRWRWVGFAAFGYRRRRPQGTHLKVHVETIDRDLLFFMIFFSIALVIGLLDTPGWFEILAGALFIVAYGWYVRQTLRGGGNVAEHHEMEPLTMDRRAGRHDTAPPNGTIVLQALVGLGAMVGGAQLFVEELLHFADVIGAPAIVLSLILAPLATELPEKANSFFWVRDGKDALALGNLTGAMVFQSTIPIFFGMVFIDWSLDRFASVSMLIGLAGGAIAYWVLRRRSEFGQLAVAGWVVLYSIFLIYVIAS